MGLRVRIGARIDMARLKDWSRMRFPIQLFVLCGNKRSQIARKKGQRERERERERRRGEPKTKYESEKPVENFASSLQKHIER